MPALPDGSLNLDLMACRRGLRPRKSLESKYSRVVAVRGHRPRLQLNCVKSNHSHAGVDLPDASFQ